MLVVGAGGFAKEVLDILIDLRIDEIYFWDDQSKEKNDFFNTYTIINSDEEVIDCFKKNNQFVIGVGQPKIRKQLADKFENFGGELVSIISPFAKISTNDVYIGNGAIIMHNVTIGPSVTIETGALIYHNAQITHDCKIGEFVEISPGAILLGKVKVGNGVAIGANSTILPQISIHDSTIIGAGAIVTKDIPEGVVAYGNPARWERIS